MTIVKDWKDQALRFLRDERGAVTVDWVVLTAAVCGIGILLFTHLTPVVFEAAANAIAAEVDAAAVRP